MAHDHDHDGTRTCEMSTSHLPAVYDMWRGWATGVAEWLERCAWRGSDLSLRGALQLDCSLARGDLIMRVCERIYARRATMLGRTV